MSLLAPLNSNLTLPFSFIKNTFASQNTQILLGGLSQNWGFYFTWPTNEIGSEDLKKATESIESSKDFIVDLSTVEAQNLNEAIKRNHDIALRPLRQVLTTRLLVLDTFIKTVQEVHPEGPIDAFRKHWLCLQLRPTDVLGFDAFLDLSHILVGASDGYLGFPVTTHLATAENLEESIYRQLGGWFYFVLDGASHFPQNSLRTAFRSHAAVGYEDEVEISFLREVIEDLKTADQSIVVLGTGVDVRDVQIKHRFRDRPWKIDDEWVVYYGPSA